jgi:hypothetical protein
LSKAGYFEKRQQKGRGLILELKSALVAGIVTGLGITHLDFMIFQAFKLQFEA